MEFDNERVRAQLFHDRPFAHQLIQFGFIRQLRLLHHFHRIQQARVFLPNYHKNLRKDPNYPGKPSRNRLSLSLSAFQNRWCTKLSFCCGGTCKNGLLVGDR